MSNVPFTLVFLHLKNKWTETGWNKYGIKIMMTHPALYRFVSNQMSSRKSMTQPPKL